jgi:putative cardiolipin synthase
MLDRMERLNHRMHNKLLIADNRATILGGRNIGNEYFGLSPTFNFRDLDLLGVGPVAQQASQVFDRFWNSKWVVPVAALDVAATSNDLREDYGKMRSELAAAPTLARFRIDRRNWEELLDAAASRMHTGTSRMHTDTPDSGTLTHHMPAAIRDLLGSARSEILIANAYIIPGEHAIGRMREQSAKGIRIRMLTNSLASHDVPAVNSHYKRWRKPLLDAGIELYEARPDAAVRSLIVDTPPTQAEYMGLHMKAMVIDRSHVFVGSMNLDPRSWEINSEMGIVVDSPGLGKELAQIMVRDMGPENAWSVALDSDGRVTWGEGGERLTRQPARNFWQRIEDIFFMAFPGELY